MFDYRSEYERRIAQFAKHLEAMRRRAHEIAQSNCYITFAERPPSSDEEGDSLIEKQKLVLQSAEGSDWLSADLNGSPFGDTAIVNMPDETWREDQSSNRFVQFAFEKNWFCLDMPKQTLFAPEPELIFRDRAGFFWVKDRKRFMLREEVLEGFDPIRKIYVYGDELSAAEDMAYVWFSLLKLPVDSRLYVTAASFDGRHRWERGLPIN